MHNLLYISVLSPLNERNNIFQLACSLFSIAYMAICLVLNILFSKASNKYAKAIVQRDSNILVPCVPNAVILVPFCE